MAKRRHKPLQDGAAVEQLVDDAWTSLQIMIGLGKPRKHLREQIARKFPGHTNADYDNVVSLALQARMAGIAAAHLKPGERLDESLVPEVPLRGVNSLALEIVVHFIHRQTGNASWKVRRVITGAGITSETTERMVREVIDEIRQNSPRLYEALVSEVRIPWIAKSMGHVSIR